MTRPPVQAMSVDNADISADNMDSNLYDNLASNDNLVSEGDDCLQCIFDDVDFDDPKNRDSDKENIPEKFYSLMEEVGVIGFFFYFQFTQLLLCCHKVTVYITYNSI